MTKKEREVIERVYLKIRHIVDWDNKNLYQRQYHTLDECVFELKEVLKN